MKFKIETTLSMEGTALVAARRIGAGEFSVSASSRLGGVPVQRLLEIPSKLLKPGRTLLMDLFVFELVDSADLSRFQKHEVVELVS